MVEGLIEHFTYAGLFLTLLAASLGLPVPEEIPIVAGGVLASQAVVRWWIALPVCLAGVLSGDIVLYWAGRRWGERLLEWRAVRRVLSPARAAKLAQGYREHGVKIVVTARHVAGFRAAAFLTAGIARVPFWRFLAADAGAALVGVPVSFGLAYLFADQVQGLLADVRRLERWLVLAAVVAAGAWIGASAWRRSRRP